MNVLVFILICYGAANNIVYGSLFEGFRKFLERFGTNGYSLHKLFTCMMCLPTWIGFVVCFTMIKLGLSEFTPFGVLSETHQILSIFLSGLLSSGAVWVLHTFQEKLER